jgi:hypothetical protein
MGRWDGEIVKVSNSSKGFLAIQFLLFEGKVELFFSGLEDFIFKSDLSKTA